MAGPLDWRDMFARYAVVVQASEGVDFLTPEDWSAQEWEEICSLPGFNHLRRYRLVNHPNKEGVSYWYYDLDMIL